MTIHHGMGRVRIGRLAAVGVPATLVTGGLAVAMLQGMVGASLASANGFGLESTSLSSKALAVRNSAVSYAGGNDATVYVQTVNSQADGLKMRSASVDLPFGLGSYGLKMTSGSSDIPLGSMTINATSLDTTGGSLSNINIGQAQSDARTATGSLFPNFNKDASNGTDNAYTGSGFSLTANGDGTATDPSVMSGVKAAAYAVHLDKLSLDDLHIGLVKGSYAPTTTNVTDADFN